MEKWGECCVKLTPCGVMGPTRARGSEVTLNLRADIPCGTSALGAPEVHLNIKGEHAVELFELLSAMKEPGADVPGIMKRLRELSDGKEEA